MNEIRFDLEDILKNKLTDDVLTTIEAMSKKTSIQKVIFWHNGKITDKQVNDFKIRCYKLINPEIEIKVTERGPQREYAWFDVINEQKQVGSRSRYSYVYPADKVSEMIRGIYNYYTVSSFLENNDQRKRVYYKPPAKEKNK